MKIAITGGTGFIGKMLVSYYLERHAEVIVISRKAPKIGDYRTVYMTWDQLEAKAEMLEDVDAVINLAGESIAQRWSVTSKERILQSRIDTTNQLAGAIKRLTHKPKVVISASGISLYGTSETEIYDESSPHGAGDFLSYMAEEWEKAAAQIQDTRIVIVRLGLVLGNQGGVYPQMKLPYRLGVGGKVGSGKQGFSWIHHTDVMRVIDYCITHADICGPVNAVAPNPVTNKEFGRVLSNVMHRPNIFPVPAFVLNMILGEMSMLLLKGQKVISKVLAEHGFTFQYPRLEQALKQLETEDN